MNSGADSAQRRSRAHERAFRFFLYDGKQCVKLLHAILCCSDRLDELLVGHRDRLAYLLHVDANRSRDVVHVVRDRARVTHQRIDVAVDAVHHVAHLRVALSEIPRCRNEKHSEQEQRNRRQSAGVGRYLLESADFRLDCLGEDRVGKSRYRLKQELGSRGQQCRHARVECKGKASIGLRSARRYKECYAQYISATAPKSDSPTRLQSRSSR